MTQFGSIRNSSTSLALLYLMHKWYEVMDTSNRIIRIIFLDFKKAFDLIDNNILLEGVRMALIKWFTTYLNDRTHYTELGNATSGLRVIRGGVPQGSKVGPTAFIIKINNLPAVIRDEMSRIMATSSEAFAIIEDDTIMFMDDSTLYEVLDVSNHMSGMPIGGLLGEINMVVKFTEDEKITLNLKKCKEMVIDFRKNKSVIPPLEVNGHVFERVKSYKLLGMWIDDNLKWKTNVKYLVKKGSKTLVYFK